MSHGVEGRISITLTAEQAAHLMISARKTIADGAGLRALVALDEVANELQDKLAAIGEASPRG